MTRRELFKGGGVSVETLIDGSGPLVVMIASLGRPAEDFDDLAARIADAGFTAARPQPRGIGESSGPMEGVSLADLAADVALVIEALGGEPAVVIGHAFGQRVARMLATTTPESGAGRRDSGGGRQGADTGEGESGACRLLRCLAERRAASGECALRIFRRRQRRHGVARRVAWRRRAHAARGDLGSQTSGRSSGEHEQSWWAGGRAPMLVIQGLQDTIALPENGRQLKAAFADRVELIEIDGAGHALLPEKPEAIANAVLAFLRRVHKAQ